MSASRRTLAQHAMRAAAKTRIQNGLDLQRPICVYDLAERLGVVVRFYDIASMEGMYQAGEPPRIHLSSLRPFARRNFTCGHELGHHVFGHGSTVDALGSQYGDEGYGSRPEERLADAFSASLLMPVAGLRRSLADRGIAVEAADPIALFAIACNFGVGYSTLVTHLAYGLELITPTRARSLLKSRPRNLSAQILGRETAAPLVVVDQHWTALTVDVEVGTTVAFVGRQVRTSEGAIDPCGGVAHNIVAYRATTPGVFRVDDATSDWAVFIRASRRAYIGLARYRHLAEEETHE